MGGDGLRENVARGITALEVQHALPATFVLLFDETWELAAQSQSLLLRNTNHEGTQQRRRGILREAPGMSFNFDMLAWHIDPRRNQAGFSPHRDRQPESARELERSFYADGTAKYVTHWIALTDANPENSCLYVIPKSCDPGYLKGDDPPEEAEEEAEDDNHSNTASKGDGAQPHFSDPLQRALPSKQSYQNIRALPRQAGQSLVFTHRLLHWGSKGNARALDVRPRIALSFVYSDADFEPPYLVPETVAPGRPHEGTTARHRSAPPFALRLLLVCAQLLIYHQRFALPTPTLRACYEYCKAHAEALDAAYRKKVFVEYVKAMKESREGLRPQNEGEHNNNIGDTTVNHEEEAAEEAPNSEDEEALLEEMLNHSDEFEDDYDDMLCPASQDQHGVSKKRKCTG